MSRSMWIFQSVHPPALALCAAALRALAAKETD